MLERERTQFLIDKDEETLFSGIISWFYLSNTVSIVQFRLNTPPRVIEWPPLLRAQVTLLEYISVES